MIVVDANIIICCVVESEQSDDARQVAQRDARWILPPLWRYEVTSSLVSLVRGRRLSQSRGLAAIAEAHRLVGGREIAVDQLLALRLAISFGISAYDAQYVALADSHGVQCVTADVPLAKKAPDIAVRLSDFIRS